jgi:hypothetical protein
MIPLSGAYCSENNNCHLKVNICLNVLFVDHPRFVCEQNVNFVELLQFERRHFQRQTGLQPGSDLGARTRGKTRLQFGHLTGYQLRATVTSRGLKKSNKKVLVKKNEK